MKSTVCVEWPRYLLCHVVLSLLCFRCRLILLLMAGDVTELLRWIEMTAVTNDSDFVVSSNPNDALLFSVKYVFVSFIYDRARLSYSLAVRVSITRWYWLKTNDHRIMQFSPPDSPGLPLLSYPKSQVNPLVTATNKTGVDKNCKKMQIFNQ